MYLWTQCYNTGPRWWKRKREIRTSEEGINDTAVPFFYADDGLVASTDPAWLQVSFNNLNMIFERVRLRTNFGQTVGMV